MNIVIMQTSYCVDITRRKKQREHVREKSPKPIMEGSFNELEWVKSLR